MNAEFEYKLKAISPLDGKYRNLLEDLSEFTSETSLIKARIAVESLYLIALSEILIIRRLSQSEKAYLRTLASRLTSREIYMIKKFEEETRHDVKAIEYGLRKILSNTSLNDVLEFIHFGLTSEDVNNLARRINFIKIITNIYNPLLEELINELSLLADTNKNLVILARTHGQSAVPTTLGKELINFAIRIHEEHKLLQRLKLTGKITGAVGNLNAHVFAYPKINWLNFSTNFVKGLGLKPNLFTTQINQYDDLIRFFHSMQRINSMILGFNQDMWRYISDDWFIQESKKEQVGSSTMPQKVNPIDFENSEGNLLMANSIMEGMCRKLLISRLQRDLSDSTVIRNIGVVFGHTIVAYKNTIAGIRKVRPNNRVIWDDLLHNWSILTEGVQTLLRSENASESYNLIRQAIKGKTLSKENWKAWIDGLPISNILKEKLYKLSPDSYTGYASRLTAMAIRKINIRGK